MITIVKVVSRNFIVDMIASIQNMFGFNMTGYEKMVRKGIEQVQKELTEKDIKLAWFRYETTQLRNGAVMIMLYGEEK